MKTIGLFVGAWLACGLVAEAIALKERPFKPERVVYGPISLVKQLGWI